MVDLLRLQRLLRNLSGNIALLEAEATADAARRSDVLVHDYIDVDDAVVSARLGDVSDLRSFVGEVASYLEEVG